MVNGSLQSSPKHQSSGTNALITKDVRPFDIAAVWPTRLFVPSSMHHNSPPDTAFDLRHRILLTKGINGNALLSASALEAVRHDARVPEGTVVPHTDLGGLDAMMATAYFFTPCDDHSAVVSGATECQPALRLSFQLLRDFGARFGEDAETQMVGRFWTYSDTAIHVGFAMTVDEGKAFVAEMQKLREENAPLFRGGRTAQNSDGDYLNAVHPRFEHAYQQGELLFAKGLMGVIGRYAVAEKLNLLSLQSSNHLEQNGSVSMDSQVWRFVNYKVVGQSIERDRIPTTSVTEMSVDGEQHNEAETLVAEPDSLFRLAYSRTLPADPEGNASASNDRIMRAVNHVENPTLTSRVQTDCISCHVSRTVALDRRVRDERRGNYLDRFHRRAATYVSSPLDVFNTVMFGVLPSHYIVDESWRDLGARTFPSVSERTANEISNNLAFIQDQWL